MILSTASTISSPVPGHLRILESVEEVCSASEDAHSDGRVNEMESGEEDGELELELVQDVGVLKDN